MQRLPTGTGVQRCVLESLQSEISMVNQTNATTELEIYDISLRRDLPLSNSLRLNNGNTYTLIASPSSYWDKGTNAIANEADNTLPYPSDIIGSSPFDSPFFKDYFRVKKRTQVVLPQGAHHKHIVLLKPNHLMDEVESQTGTMYGFKGLTMYSLVVIKGTPSTDTDAADAPTTTPTLLACVQSFRYKFTWVQDETYTGSYTTNLTTPVPQPTIINIGSGQLDTFKEAY